ncbi:MAG: response regulator [Proteobacteria bacterium]|nr:response regulator [Pseudomonadota bacterium]MBU1717379.1 response regulator [Pseudomonadota bacterium]
MNTPWWPVVWVDILGSLVVVFIAFYAIHLAFRLKKIRGEDVFANYLFMLTLVIGVFAVFRSGGHLVKQILLAYNYVEWWSALAPFSGAGNTLTFAVIFAFSIYYRKVGQLKGEMDKAAFDLAASKAMVAVTEASELRMRAIFDGMEDAVYVVDEDFKIIFYNRKMKELFPQISSQDKCYKVTMGREGRCEECKLHKVLLDKRKILREFTFVGIEKRFDLLELPMDWIDGRLVKLTVARDISEQKALEAQLAHSQKMEAVGTLAGGLAHDINNMLTPIIGHVEMARRKLSPDDLMIARFEAIGKCAKRASSLISQVLAFSRRQILDPTLVDLNQRVTETTSMLKHLVEENIALELKLADDLWLISADSGQLEQILVNLAVNARDAMPTGGTLLIETLNNKDVSTYCRSCGERIIGPYVVLMVSDSGAGIDQEVCKRIFEPYFTTKGVNKGTGLGLSMVDGIVHQHGGHINLYSEKDTGTTFKIYLPSADKPDEVIDILGDNAFPGELPVGKETILVVEDNEDVLQFTTECLMELGYDVMGASCPDRALDIFKKKHHDIDMILTDVVMGAKNGRQLVREALQINPQLRSMFMSGYTDNIIAHHGIMEKGLFFINKPFNPGDLAVMVRKTLDSERRFSA